MKMFQYLHCVWYRRIREERNWGERDRRKIAHFSSLADKSLNAWGPHISDSPQNCEEIAERFVSNLILVANYRKEKKHIK
jgi:hypothetical protein